jgi:formyl-CoA transferase
MAARNQNRATLIPVMQAVTRTRTTADWVAFLEDKAVPCGPINTLSEAFADAQVQARNLVINQAVDPVDTAQVAPESIATVASPLRLLQTPPVLRNAPPALGQHTDVVLAQLGLDAAAIARLRQAGVV